MCCMIQPPDAPFGSGWCHTAGSSQTLAAATLGPPSASAQKAYTQGDHFELKFWKFHHYEIHIFKGHDS